MDVFVGFLFRWLFKLGSTPSLREPAGSFGAIILIQTVAPTADRIDSLPLGEDGKLNTSREELDELVTFFVFNSPLSSIHRSAGCMNRPYNTPLLF